MKKFSIFGIKFFVVFLAVGFFSPSVTVETSSPDGIRHVSFSILNSVEARRGGGGMRGGGMRGGGMRGGGMSRGGFSRGGMSRGSFNRGSM